MRDFEAQGNQQYLEALMAHSPEGTNKEKTVKSSIESWGTKEGLVERNSNFGETQSLSEPEKGKEVMEEENKYTKFFLLPVLQASANAFAG